MLASKAKIMSDVQLDSQHRNWEKECLRADNLDESSIIDALKETFCYPPTKTVHEMSPEELMNHLDKLQNVIGIIKTHSLQVERRISERKKKNKEESREFDKLYKAKPTERKEVIVSSKLSKVEKALFKLANHYEVEYLELKKIWKENGMKGVNAWIEENCD